jgi:hypothetical protein
LGHLISFYGKGNRPHGEHSFGRAAPAESHLHCIYCEEEWDRADLIGDAIFGREWMCPSCEAWSPIQQPCLPRLFGLVRSILHFVVP